MHEVCLDWDHLGFCRLHFLEQMLCPVRTRKLEISQLQTFKFPAENPTSQRKGIRSQLVFAQHHGILSGRNLVDQIPKTTFRVEDLDSFVAKGFGKSCVFFWGGTWQAPNSEGFCEIASRAKDLNIWIPSAGTKRCLRFGRVLEVWLLEKLDRSLILMDSSMIFPWLLWHRYEGSFETYISLSQWVKVGWKLALAFVHLGMFRWYKAVLLTCTFAASADLPVGQEVCVWYEYHSAWLSDTDT